MKTVGDSRSYFVFSVFCWHTFKDVTISFCSSATWHVLFGFLQKYQTLHRSICVLLGGPIWKTHFPDRKFFKNTAGYFYSDTDKPLVNILEVQRYFQIRDGLKKLKRPFYHVRISWSWFLHYSNINHNLLPNCAALTKMRVRPMAVRIPVSLFCKQS